LWYFSLT